MHWRINSHTLRICHPIVSLHKFSLSVEEYRCTIAVVNRLCGSPCMFRNRIGSRNMVEIILLYHSNYYCIYWYTPYTMQWVVKCPPRRYLHSCLLLETTDNSWNRIQSFSLLGHYSSDDICGNRSDRYYGCRWSHRFRHSVSLRT